MRLLAIAVVAFAALLAHLGVPSVQLAELAVDATDDWTRRLEVIA